MKWRLSEVGWRLLPGSLAAGFMGILVHLSALQPLEQIAYRTRFQVRGELGWDDRIVLVAIDDLSLKHLGRFPWPRQYYAHLIENLTKAEPSAIAINLLWSEPSPQDSELAAAMLAQGRVILAQAHDPRGYPLPPVPQLQEAAIAVGHIMQSVDSDGIARTLVAEVNGYPALGIVSGQVHALIQEAIELPPPAPILGINWPGSAQHLQKYSFVDVLQGQVPSAVFHDKIVLLGVTATGIDPLATPFDQSPPASSVYIHAAVIDNLLRQRFLSPLTQPWLVGLLLGLGGPVLGGVISYRPMRQQLVILLGLLMGWGLLDLLLFRAALLLPLALPMLLFGCTGLAVAIVERLRENCLLQAKIEQLWSDYYQDLVWCPADPAPPQATPAHHFPPLWRNTFARELNLPQSRRRVAQLTALAEQFGRSQSAQAAIARNLSIGLLAADLDGRIWFCNPQASHWLQVEVGQNLSERLVPAWLSQQQWQDDVQRLTTTNSVITRELKQGNNWFEMILEPLVYRPLSPRQATAIPEGLLLLLEDINHRKQIEANLQQAKEAAEAASRTKGEFLANMSHELRTPLNIILGFVQVMRRDTTLTPENARYLDIIDRSGQDLLHLINEVLEMSKLEAGELCLHENVFDLCELLNNLEEMLQVKVAAKPLTFIFEWHPQTPRHIKADEQKLRQILINLLSNAIKFTEKGYITCRVFPIKTEQDETESSPIRQLRFEIQDTGPGIDSAEQHKLFKPFSQTEIGEAAQEGTGLGLAISRRLVNLMGGDISVSSIVGQGSTFSFTIPLKAGMMQTGSSLEISLEKMSEGKRSNDVPEQLQSSYRILGIDHRWENCCFLEHTLNKVGFTVRTTKNVEEGFSLWQNWQPHLIFIDIQASVIEGYELMHKIRTQESSIGLVDRSQQSDSKASSWTVAGSPTEYRSILIATSANIFSGTRSAILAAGFNDCLQYPIAEDELLNKVAQYLPIAPIAHCPCEVTCIPLPRSVNAALTLESLPAPLPPPPSLADLTAALQEMPPAWIEQLSEAAIRGSDDHITQLLAELAEADLSTAQRRLHNCLAIWNNNFQFDQILNLIQRLNT
ncbi:CHASE2 domain-containing protein [Trichothermofontia sp.]